MIVNATVCFQPGSLDFSNQLLAPGGKGMWGSWGKGSSGGTGAKPANSEQGKYPKDKCGQMFLLLLGNFLNFSSCLDSGRSTTSTLNRFSALQQSGSLSSSAESDRRVPQRYSFPSVWNIFKILPLSLSGLLLSFCILKGQFAPAAALISHGSNANSVIKSLLTT